MAEAKFANLQSLLARPHESQDVEVKGWLDLGDHDQRADLAKAILAVANHGGGFVILGLREDAGQFPPDHNRPSDLSKLTQDDIQNAVEKYLEPAIQCRVNHVEHPDGHGQFPIIAVPGGCRVPIKAKVGSPDGKLVANRVYVRRPGPKSEEPQTAAEWDQLFERCIRARRDELLDGIRDLLAGQVPNVETARETTVDGLANFIEQAELRWAARAHKLPRDTPPLFPHGYIAVGVAIDGNFPVQTFPDFMETLRGAVRNHSGWPPFPILSREVYRPRIVDDAIEAWFGPDEHGKFDSPRHCDFWRASPDGFLYMRKGFDEDSRYRDMKPGLSFDITTPTRRLGEILLQAHYIAIAMGAKDASVLVQAEWFGLSERQLVSVGNPRRRISGTYRAHQNAHKGTVETSVVALADALPEVVYQVLAPLYTLFDFFRLSKRMVEEELREMRRNEF